MLALMVIPPNGSGEIIRRHDVADSAYVSYGKRFPAVGKVGRLGDATLIAPRWVLTAGHIASRILVGAQPVSVVIEGESYTIDSVVVHPDWREMELPDIGLIRLSRAVEGVEPILVLRDAIAPGLLLTLVGHGANGVGDSRVRAEDGVRRAATSALDSSSANAMFFSFTAPPNASKLEGAPGRGDSGGPALIQLNGKWGVVGVSSGGYDGVAGPGSYGAVDVFTRIDAYADWIASAIRDKAVGFNPLQAQEITSEYRVRIDTALDRVFVEARLPATSSALSMDPVQAQHLRRGWATHVTSIRATAGGRSIVVSEADSGASWKLGPRKAGPLVVTYEVDLAFAGKPWPAGNEQAGATFRDALYIVGRALFVFSDVTGPSRIHFDVPGGWRVSAPWRREDGTALTFVADSASELARNSLVVGRHAAVELSSDSFRLTLALPGETGASATQVETILRPVLAEYLRMFRGTGRARYLMTFFRSSAEDGESYLNSAAFTTAEEVRPATAVIWANFLAHELMHFWNGQRIRGSAPRTEWRWISEGFTEYYANVTLVRTGALPEDFFLKKAERHLGNYLYFATAPWLTRMSLVSAGRNTSVNRFGVYDGGWTVAFCLDGRIREASGDRKSLDDFMALVWERYGRVGRGYTVAGLDSIANEVAEIDLGGAIHSMVSSEQAIPLADCLSRFGWDVATKGYAAEAFMSIDPNAKALSTARRSALFRRSASSSPL